MNENFVLMPIHAHVLVAGWLSLAMAGVIYRAYPAASDTRLAQAHFWLHNVLLPVGALAFAIGLLCFSLNVWRHVRG